MVSYDNKQKIRTTCKGLRFPIVNFFLTDEWVEFEKNVSHTFGACHKFMDGDNNNQATYAAEALYHAFVSLPQMARKRSIENMNIMLCVIAIFLPRNIYFKR